MSLTMARQTIKYVQVEELSCLVICVLLNPLIGYSFPISTMQATTARKVLKLPQPHRVTPLPYQTSHKFSSSQIFFFLTLPRTPSSFHHGTQQSF